MQQIADWLKTLGMSEYAQRFAENRIDFSVLPDLTDQDLKDLGIILGDRRKMLRAIAQMTSAGPAALARTVAAEPKVQDTAERRQVTVMFSDLVGSTALSARMDPEDLRDISAYQKCVAATVERFGGFVANYMGGRRPRVFWPSESPWKTKVPALGSGAFQDGVWERGGCQRCVFPSRYANASINCGFRL
jgi:class 3 adenylate cyclase